MIYITNKVNKAQIFPKSTMKYFSENFSMIKKYAKKHPDILQAQHSTLLISDKVVPSSCFKYNL